MKKIENKETIIKPAEKSSIIVVISSDHYWNICHSHISDTTYYGILNDADPSNIAQQRVTQFGDKYKSMLTSKEYNYLTKRKHKISNLYMFPILHNSKQINEIIQKEQCKYITIVQNIIVEAGPTFAGPVFHTNGISEILHIILEPSLIMISHRAKDSMSKIDHINIVLMEPKLVLVILNHMQIFDMIFFIQDLNTGFKNCKIVYRYCDVLIDNLFFKAGPLF